MGRTQHEPLADQTAAARPVFGVTAAVADQRLRNEFNMYDIPDRNTDRILRGLHASTPTYR